MSDFGGFDATVVEPATGNGGGPIPAGKYKAMIVKGEKRQNKKKNGSLFEFVFEVVDGEHKGRRLWSYINFENPSSQCQSIGRAELSAICHATGVLRPQQTAQLFNIPLVVQVMLEDRDDKPELKSNRIIAYLPMEVAGPQGPKPSVDASDDPFA